MCYRGDVGEASLEGRQLYRTSMRDVRLGLTEAMRPMAADIRAMIEDPRYSDAEGKMLRSRKVELQRRAGERVTAFFVGVDGRSAFDAEFRALSPMADLLNRFYVRVTAEAVYNGRNWLADNAPEDVYRWLVRLQPSPRPFVPSEQFRTHSTPTHEADHHDHAHDVDVGDAYVFAEGIAPSLPYIEVAASDNPFMRRAGEENDDFYSRVVDDLRVFRPNPLAEYEPMHTWVDPRGYDLSYRIWQTGQSTRLKLDQMLEEGINEGVGALELAKRVERFLLPGRANLRTNKPYGVNASFDAMRLARTEIARAANQAAWVSALLNPYVGLIDVARSATGDPRCPICPRHATIGIGGGRIRPPYETASARIPVFHPHCKCHIRPVVVDSPATVTRRLRALVDDINRTTPLPNTVTIAQPDALLSQMLGRALHSMVGQVVQPMLL